MSYDITNNMRLASEQGNIEPNIVLEINGISTLFGGISIKKYIQIGDTGLEIGDSWTIGGLNEIEDQSPYISFQSGTSTQIRQNLNQDKGVADSISSLQISVIDKNEEITNIISPGQIVEDIIGRRCKIHMGFNGTAWPEDYIVIFRGIIESVGSKPGLITFNITHPDKKKQSDIYIKTEAVLSSSMGTGDTVASVDATTNFLVPITGPDGSIDDVFKSYIKIDDEIIRYEAKSSSQIQSLTRGQLGTTAATHSSGASVESYYRLTGNAINDLALKLMLSGWNGPFEEDVSLTNFNRIRPSEVLSNSISFKDIDVSSKYNLQVGDFITTTGASNGANNVTLKEITEIGNNDFGSYIVINGVSFVEEINSSAVIDFRSQYDTLPSGLKMHSDEVDISEHKYIYNTFLSSADMDFYIDDTIEDAQSFLSEQIYNPLSAFSIPRKAQSSIGYHIGPLPTIDIKSLNSTNVLNASSLSIRRSTSNNFFNSVIYKYEVDPIDTSRFTKGVITTDSTSLNRIPIGNKVLTIEAKGLRESLGADLLANTATSKRLRKYKYGAEYINGVKVNFATGFNIEIGDIVLFDLSSLKVSDIKNASRNGESRLFECVNKTLNIKTGDISLDLVDTNFDKDARYCLISPSSYIKSGSSTTKFIIEGSFNTSRFGKNEYKKWEKWIGSAVVIRSSDFSINDTSYIHSIDMNEITLSSALSFTPLNGYVMELDHYANQPDNIKLVYGFMSDTDFADGGIQYQMI